MLAALTDALRFSTVGEFFAMGGYAFNVWSVYGLFLLFLGVILYYPVLRRRQILRQISQRLRQQGL